MNTSHVLKRKPSGDVAGVGGLLALEDEEFSRGTTRIAPLPILVFAPVVDNTPPGCMAAIITFISFVFLILGETMAFWILFLMSLYLWVMWLINES